MAAEHIRSRTVDCKRFDAKVTIPSQSVHLGFDHEGYSCPQMALKRDRLIEMDDSARSIVLASVLAILILLASMKRMNLI